MATKHTKKTGRRKGGPTLRKTADRKPGDSPLKDELPESLQSEAEPELIAENERAALGEPTIGQEERDAAAVEAPPAA
jgi:hypothetical protein